MKKKNFLIKFKYQNSIFNINFFFFKELKHPILLSLEWHDWHPKFLVTELSQKTNQTCKCCKLPLLCSLSWAMATLSHSHFLTFLSLPSRKLFLLPQQHLHLNNLHCETQEHPPPKQFTTCALSNKKPRFQFLICLVLCVCICFFYGFSFVSYLWVF